MTRSDDFKSSVDELTKYHLAVNGYKHYPRKNVCFESQETGEISEVSQALSYVCVGCL